MVCIAVVVAYCCLPSMIIRKVSSIYHSSKIAVVLLLLLIIHHLVFFFIFIFHCDLKIATAVFVTYGSIRQGLCLKVPPSISAKKACMKRKMRVLDTLRHIEKRARTFLVGIGDIRCPPSTMAAVEQVHYASIAPKGHIFTWKCNLPAQI